MNIAIKLLIALLVAAAATGITLLLDNGLTTAGLFALMACATLVTAVLTHFPGSAANAGRDSSSGRAPGSPAAAPRDAAPGRGREQGAVKWFSQKKGFGFIIRDSGDEIFVHYRNILGEGRRTLRDGERVTFRVSQTDKGPQAEEVESID